MNGIVVINKDKNMTSRDVVNIISQKFKTKKVGHGGTLDPLATGVLVIGINKYTKVLNLLEDSTKEYIAEVLIGKNTDTLDVTGKVLEEVKVNEIDVDKLKRIILSFKKKYTQTIPLYSAKKINGKKLYEYARSNIEIDLPTKDVEIYDINLLDVYEKDNNYYFKFYCKVSKGTFIRSLINDIGKEYGVPMTMNNLQRTAQGNFKIEQSNHLEDEKYNIYKISDIFDYPIYKLNKEMYSKIANGMMIPSDGYEDVVLFMYAGYEVAIYQKSDTLMKCLQMLK